MQVATITTTFTAEEGTEFKEVDVATWELKSRHHEQPVQPTAAPGDVATRRPTSRHHNQQMKTAEDVK